MEKQHPTYWEHLGDFVGTLSWDVSLINIMFSVVVTNEGSLQIDVQHISFDESARDLQRRFNEQSGKFALHNLKGQNSTGCTIMSDDLFIRGTTLDFSAQLPLKIHVGYSSTSITMLPNAPRDLPCYRRYTKGMRARSSSIIKTVYGYLQVISSNQESSDDEIFSYIELNSYDLSRDIDHGARMPKTCARMSVRY